MLVETMKLIIMAQYQMAMGGNNYHYIDMTRPTVTGVNKEYVKTGVTVTVTGAGYATPANTNHNVIIGTGADKLSYSIANVASDNSLTFNSGGGNKKGVVYIKDKAGNVSNNNIEITVDNSLPVLSSVDVKSAKQGGKAIIAGDKFKDGNESPIKTLTINDGSTGVGSWVVDNDDQITLTAGSGNVAYTQIKVTDEAGNVSTDVVKVAIDNTAPTISNVRKAGTGTNQSKGKSGDQIDINGSDLF